MEHITTTIRRLKASLFVMKCLEHGLNSLMILLIILGITLFFTTYHNLIAITLLIFCIIYTVYRALKDCSIKEIEKRVPNLEWQLRTAADNIHKQNEVIDSLHNTILQKAGYVGPKNFFSSKKTLTKVALLLLISVLVGYSSTIDLSFKNLQQNLGEKTEGVGTKITGLFTDSLNKIKTTASTRNIFGEEEELIRGSKELNVQLTPEENALDLDQLSDAEQRQFNEQGLDKPVGEPKASGSSNEKIYNKDQEEIIKKYYENLNKE